MAPAKVELRQLLNEERVSKRRVNQACEACKRRKVRCNGESTCDQCGHLQLSCVYRESKRGGPRKNAAPRGTVIEECRSGMMVVSPQHFVARARVRARRYSKDFFLGLIQDYMDYVYPVNPVIAEVEVRTCIERWFGTPMLASEDGLRLGNTHNMDENLKTEDKLSASFLYALAAVTINLTRTHSAKETREQIEDLMDRSISLIDSITISQPSLLHVMRSIFIEICLMGLRKPLMGLYYLRDAISTLYLLGVDNPQVLKNLPPPERAKLQRAYWECFIHERFTALTVYKPVCLSPLPTDLEHDPTLDGEIEKGWNYIIQTFRIIDSTFVNYWIKNTPAPAEWIEKKHQELVDEKWMYEVTTHLTELQQADLIITRQWLRTLTWELALRSVPLSTEENNTDFFSLSFPLRLSHDLRKFLQDMTLSREAVGLHGSGILHKLFEITDSIANLIINVPDATKEDTIGRVKDILFLKKFIFSFSRIDELHKDMLKRKFQQIQKQFSQVEEVDELMGSPFSSTSAGSPMTIS
jgi:hypothetical protein